MSSSSRNPNAQKMAHLQASYTGAALQTRIDKGDRLVQMMRATIDEASQMLKADSAGLEQHSESPLQDKDSLKALSSNGWREKKPSPNYAMLEREMDLVHMETVVGIYPTRGVGSETKYVGFEQNGTFVKDGQTYPATGAFVHGYYNTKAGFNGAISTKSPQARVSDGRTEVMPDLSHWSDVVFNIWASLGSSVPAPRHIAQLSILNEETRWAIDYACRSYTDPLRKDLEQANTGMSSLKDKENWYPPKWPGLTFDMDCDAAKVLLQTPNGKCVAWLLINHKKAFECEDRGKDPAMECE